MMKPNGSRLELRVSDQESLLPEGRRARSVWAGVEQADLDRILREARRWSVTRITLLRLLDRNKKRRGERED